MRATIHLVLLTALRDRLFSGLFALLAVTIALAVFLGGTAINERLQAVVVFAAGGGRLILVLGLTIFAAFHIQALFETREVEAILSRAISRSRFVLAYWISLVCLAALLAIPFGGALAVISSAGWPVLLWTATLVAECAIVLGVALFAGLMLERATSTVLFTAGFYALARLMGFFVGIRETATDSSAAEKIIKYLLDGVLLFIPRLDLFAQSRWLIYAPDRTALAIVAAQAGLFLALVLGATSFDLRRKQF